ncbi:nicotinate-nucleotide--dimethylbenzimidazole phosphoribosyltransferase [Diaphorobacter ruginosibacter]|uniref:Nicotinate-nucleotide--dimethylbenzimidazole phosphoribosyltransferase n=1 Tax=Diaphorobacter ruginosibacter TaxID=1715720 RepID=A0A7G9RKD0_9BURK|nr:nicotinate-nucleotide--dimethylbenzimidazole phosphoribosyltransferase [Diaphorobacter ruginosibacter]QNN56055.1 nicotinate-nucleotide--dimethylbenzimidazole phosphoribosyltransferase [Diaphorobacter ruginosibacter]
MLIPEVPSISDAQLSARLQARIDSKTKPLGALGKLEVLAHRIGCILGSEEPVLREPQMLVCAADHGLAANGVSAYPSDVTWQMVENFLAGGAAVSVLARQNGLALTVADCGVAREIPPREQAQGAPRLVSCRVAAGTQDASAGPAMSMAQCAQAVDNGRKIVQGMPGNALLLGEMGIGNTSVASLLLARLGGVPLADCTGAGTGLNAEGVARKRKVLEAALAANADAREPMQALAALGGFEVATLTGAVLQAAAERRVIVVDGFITTAAVLVASRLQPAVLERCVFAHRSGEPGHAHMLRLLNGEALLDMGLRLGEGSGAALAWPLLLSACAFLREMASFESAGVDGSHAA